MTGVNDQAESWRALAGEPQYPAPRTYRAGFDNGVYSARSACAFDLESQARTAWRKVKEPPTKADADAWDFVAVYMRDGSVDMANWIAVREGMHPEAMYWARIRDVVLLPASTTGEG